MEPNAESSCMQRNQPRSQNDADKEAKSTSDCDEPVVSTLTKTQKKRNKKKEQSNNKIKLSSSKEPNLNIENDKKEDESCENVKTPSIRVNENCFSEDASATKNDRKRYETSDGRRHRNYEPSNEHRSENSHRNERRGSRAKNDDENDHSRSRNSSRNRKKYDKTDTKRHCRDNQQRGEKENHHRSEVSNEKPAQVYADASQSASKTTQKKISDHWNTDLDNKAESSSHTSRRDSKQKSFHNESSYLHQEINPSKETHRRASSPSQKPKRSSSSQPPPETHKNGKNWPFGYNQQPQQQNWPKKNKKNRKDDKPFVTNKAHESVITEVYGDLFTAGDDYSLAHCVGQDFRMGAGIAVTFRKLFGRVDKLLAQNARVGEVAILSDGERYIFNLVTKSRSNGKPTMQTIQLAIQKLKYWCEKLQVKKLAIPQIGCGLDRLDWDDVKEILYQEFRETETKIVVYVWR